MSTLWRHWLRRTLRSPHPVPCRRPARPAPAPRLSLEALEGRALPAVYTVTTAADVIDANDGLLSLREAVLAANASAGVADTIVLPAGTYTLTRTGADEDAAATGDLDLWDDVTVQGAGAAAALIDGNAADRVFDVQAGSVTLTGLTVRNGSALSGVAGSPDGQGGGVRSRGTLALTDCTVTANQSRGVSATGPGAPVGAGFGGGIYQFGGSLTLTGCTVSNNEAVGGAATIANSAGTNTAGQAAGGGVYVAGGQLTVTASTVIANRALGGSAANASGAAVGGAAGGGGIGVASAGANVAGVLSLTASDVADNRAEGGAATGSTSATGGAATGGGVQVIPAGPHTISASTLAGNRAVGGRGEGGAAGFGGMASGGGLALPNSWTLSNSTLSGNQAVGGGAATTGTAPEGRAGDARGGGLVATGGLATNSTVTGNAAAAGAGNRAAGAALGGGAASPVAGGGGTAFRSTILAGNVAATSPDVYRPATSSATSLGNNLVGDGTGAPGFVNGTAGDQVGTAAAPIDPRLGPLADNGGPTPTHAPLNGSPAVNRGSNAAGLATDQRGSPRAVGTGPDVGAVESPFTPPTAAADALPDVTTAGSPAYTFTVTYADDVAVDAASLGDGDVVVTGPNGFSAAAVFVSVSPSGNGTPRTATYFFAPPGGTWDASDYGTYTLSVAPLRVADTAGGLTPPGPLGSFRALVPGTFTVTNANDAGPGSLRDAVAQANAHTSTADTIAFDPAYFGTPRTITLTTGQILISDPLTVAGPGAGLLTVSGNNASRIFSFDGPGQMAVTLSGLTLTAGRATGANFPSQGGGAVLNRDERLTLTDCVLTGNTAVASGGAVTSYDPGASVTLLRTTLSNNTALAEGAAGGGLYQAGGDLLVQDSVVAGNTASDGGGLSGGRLTLLNSTVAGNRATYDGGGGILTGLPLLIRNSTIVNNWTSGEGGGVNVLYEGQGAITIQNSTIVGNVGGGAAGVYAYGSSTAQSTVTSSVISGVFISTSFLLTSSAVSSSSDLRLAAGSGNNLPYGTDPKLSPLGDYGGPTPTLVPLPGSPLIDAGANPAALATDQRGLARTVGAGTDIGAVEVNDRRPIATPPALPNVTAAGPTAYTFGVTYYAADGLNVAGLGDGDVRVTGPNGFDVPAALVSVDTPANGSPRTATYRFTPPGGAWDGADNGTYALTLAANQVFDTAGRSAPPAALGSFRVAIPITFLVTNANDGGPGSLRDALDRANASAPSADTITFDPTFFATPRTITLARPLIITDSVTVNGPGAGRLTLDGGGLNRIVTMVTPGLAASLSGLTFTGGHSTADLSWKGGGAVFDRGGDLTVSDCVFTGNTAPDSLGGAIAVAVGSLTVRDSTFTGNSARDQGGAINVSEGGRLTAVRSTFAQNSATSAQSLGGGIVLIAAGLSVIQDCTITGNRAFWGGGLVGYGTTSLTLLGSAVVDNTAGSDGAGLYFDASSNPLTLAVRNSTLSRNAATGRGGALYVRPGFSAYTVRLENDTLAGNGAMHFQGGGGLYVDGPSTGFTVVSSVIAGNTAPSGSDIASGALLVTSSAVGSASGFTLAAGSDNNLPYGSDLKLGPLGSYGGPTVTMVPLPGSPLLDAGANPAALATDQRGPGYVRVFGAAADIGAAEFQPSHVAAVTVNGGAAQRSRVTEVTVRFDTLVTLPANPAAAFRLTRTGPGGTLGDVALAVDLSGSTATQTVARLTFSGPLAAAGSLVDGDYSLTVFGAQVLGPGGLPLDGDNNGAAGGDSTFSLYRLFGDTNGDRRVDAVDLFGFAGGFGKRRGEAGYLDALDTNGDGVLDALDLFAFAGNFGKSLP